MTNLQQQVSVSNSWRFVDGAITQKRHSGAEWCTSFTVRTDKLSLQLLILILFYSCLLYCIMFVLILLLACLGYPLNCGLSIFNKRIFIQPPPQRVHCSVRFVKRQWRGRGAEKWGCGLCTLTRFYILCFHFNIVHSGAFSYTNPKVLFAIECRERYVIMVFLAIDSDTDITTSSFHQFRKPHPVSH